MTDKEFRVNTYKKIREAILRIDESKVAAIYVISFFIHNADDDPRQPMLTIGFNTNERWKFCTPSAGQDSDWPVASNSDEAKWNSAFWLQNVELEIGGNESDSVSEWVSSSPYYYTGEQEENDSDLTFELGQKIHDEFIEVAIGHAQKLHSDGVVKTKFGTDIPIIIHELEYYDKPLSWTKRANPVDVAKEFEKWIESF